MAAPWRPQPGPQMAFHRSAAFECLYGGAAGGGKSDSLLIEALRYAHVPGYTALILRRTFPQLSQAKGLIPRSQELLNSVAKWSSERATWTFPSGATLAFGHMQYENDMYDYQGSAYAFIGFDELTHFTEPMYRYLFSRARTMARLPDGRVLPVRVRATTNPGGVGHEWVRRRWWAWLGDQPTAASGELRYYVVEGDLECDAPAAAPGALSRQFIAARVFDNPALLRVDPGYVQRLQALPLLERKRLLEGDWTIAPRGNVFRREWFRVVERAPEGLRWVRYWDLAASVRESADYLASVAAALAPDGVLYLRDMIRGKWEWPEQERILSQTMLAEPQMAHGIEKALHGLAALQTLLRKPELARTTIRGIDVDRDKLSRALPLSARAEQGKVALVRGAWIGAFLDELCAFSGDGKTHDDQVDTAAGGLAMLAQPARSRKLVTY